MCVLVDKFFIPTVIMTCRELPSQYFIHFNAEISGSTARLTNLKVPYGTTSVSSSLWINSCQINEYRRKQQFTH